MLVRLLSYSLASLPLAAAAEPTFVSRGRVETQLQVHVDHPERLTTDYRLNDYPALAVNLGGAALGGVFAPGPVDARVVLRLGRGAASPV